MPTPAKAQDRFKDDGRRLRDELELILVVCPRCGEPAEISPLSSGAQPRTSEFEPRLLACTGCHHTDQKQIHAVATATTVSGTWVDPYFGLPIYLQRWTRLGVLFAYNRDHLEWLARFVAAGLRERDMGPPWDNKSMASRLPHWIKVAKNRSTVLRAIEKLRRLLAEK